MKDSSIISQLRAKYAEKNWNETFQLVRRCMDRPRDEWTPCERRVRSLERLQEAFNMSSLSATRCRLENVAKLQGMGFHTSEHTCFLTADLFYLEVALQAQGVVEDVKVAKHGGNPSSSETFLHLLRSKNFPEFSRKLASLHSQYDLPGDNETKMKLFSVLQHLCEDLEELSRVSRAPDDIASQTDLINEGLIGRFIAGREDCPLTLQFYQSPADAETTNSECVTQQAQVCVIDSCLSHPLQTTSTILKPLQLDPHGIPVFVPVTDVSHDVLSACFLLKLQPPMLMLKSFVERIHRITDAPTDLDLQWAPFPSLLKRGHLGAAAGEYPEERDGVFSTLLPGGASHRYVFPEASWETPGKRVTLVEKVPFSRPVHVPHLVQLLRHQAAINALLRSCTRSTVSRHDLHFEVFLESDTSFSVTFQRPDADSLAVLLVEVHDHRRVSCRLFGSREDNASALEELLSAVTRRFMSVPVTMQSLYDELADRADRAAVRIPSGPSDPSGTSVTDTSSASTAAAVPGARPPAAGPGSESTLPPQINAASLPPRPLAGLWISCDDQLAELL